MIEGLDDAFLAFANERPIYAPPEGLPSTMVLVQGDVGDPVQDQRLDRAIQQFMAAQKHVNEVGFVEGIPPEDFRRAEPFVADSAPFYPFMRIWEEGFPARAGQRWLTTRFHFHLLAAAAGASGAVLNARPGYYDIKHESLQELGTGWTTWAPDDEDSDAGVNPAPVRSVDFPARAEEFGLRKTELASRLYLGR